MKDLKEVLKEIKALLEFKLIEVADYKITIGNLLAIVAIVIATWVVSKLLRKILYRSKKLDQGQKYSIYQIVRYVIWVVAIAYCLESLGVEFTLLLAGSAALMVGLGLGLQQTFNDFVSGVIILVEGVIKVGDIIEVDGTVARVKHIGLRTTKVISRDDITLILPNNVLTNHSVINWSHAQETARFKVSVGVDYSSDVDLVTKILLDCVENHKAVLKKPKPFVRFEDFGNSSLDFSIYFWSDRIFPIENVKSEIRYSISKSFRANNVTIPFPQRVVHMAGKED